MLSESSSFPSPSTTISTSVITPAAIVSALRTVRWPPETLNTVNQPPDQLISHVESSLASVDSVILVATDTPAYVSTATTGHSTNGLTRDDGVVAGIVLAILLLFLMIPVIGFLFYRRRERARAMNQGSDVQGLTKHRKSPMPMVQAAFELEGDAGKEYELEANFAIPELDGSSKDRHDIQGISEMRASIATAEEHKSETSEGPRSPIYEMRTSIATAAAEWRESRKSTKHATTYSIAMTEASKS